ncbi:MAG: sigma-70 family RNA polymerase sigma factor [bacterium]|nr:sigma-70 family RNA polymerase sigma factor [bacterium]
MDETRSELDELLERCRENDREALDELMPRVIDEVRGLARKAMASENSGHTLQTTALVNEAYLKLTRRPALGWNDRKHLLCDLAEMMRRILRDHARRKSAGRRGKGARRLSLDEMRLPASEPPPYLEELEEALEELQAVDRGKYDIVMLRFYMGLTEREIANELDVSVNTVHRRWQAARTWLLGKLQPDAA